MKIAKLVFVYSALVVFLSVSVIGILGALGKISISGWEAVIALLGSCLGIVTTVLNAKHLFDDPDAIRELRDKHQEAILRMKREHADVMDQESQSRKTVEAALSDEVSRLKKYAKELTSSHTEEVDQLKARVSHLSEEVRRLKAPPPPRPRATSAEVIGP